MPIYEFRCPSCFHVVECIQKYNDAAPICEGNPFERHQAVPTARIWSRSSFKVNGFNSMNGYTPARTITQKHGSVTTTVSGNFEAFADGLVK